MGLNGKARRRNGEAASANGATTIQPLRVVKRRKKRATSIEAEIRKAAKQIEATRMADAYKAAALGIVARKQDEILVKQNEIAAILHAAGPFGNVAQSRPASAGVVGQVVRQQPTGAVCARGGQPAVGQST